MNRLKEIDILRGIGAIAVIIIHLTSSYVTFSDSSYTYLIWGSINRLLTFAVPLFLAISALVMTYKAKENKKIDIKKFYTKRLFKVISALIVWSSIYLLYLWRNNLFVINPFNNPKSFIIEYIILGKACYHLYFIPIIVQLYIFFPIIWFVVKKLEAIKINFYLNFAIWFLILSVMQWAFLKFYGLYVYNTFQNTAVLLPSYILPIGMGIWLGFNFDSFFKKRTIFKLLILISTILVGYWYVNGQLFNYTFYIRILLMLYATLIILSLAILANFVKECQLLSKISYHSFFIYLVHPLIMLVLEGNYKWTIHEVTSSAFFNYSIDISIKFAIVFGISYFLAWIWGSIIEKYHKRDKNECK